MEGNESFSAPASPNPVDMQDHASDSAAIKTDPMSPSSSFPSIQPDSQDMSLSNNSTTSTRQDSAASHDLNWSTTGVDHPTPEQAPSSENPATSQPSNPSADALFLLKILSLPPSADSLSLSSLHPRPPGLHPAPLPPALLARITNILGELHLSPDVITLGAALLPRATALRLEHPIFPPDSPWYDEEKTPNATLAVALRVAQLFLEGEGRRRKGEWYPIWGFYPWEDLARFARALGDPEMKVPGGGVGGLWETWCELRREFEQQEEERVVRTGNAIVMKTGKSC